MARFEIEPRGPFTLASAARFINGWPPGKAHATDDEVRLRFLVDDWSGPATVVLTQPGDTVHGTVEADNEPRAIEQATRIVSLDHDGSAYPDVGERDPIVGELQRESGYLRPVLFHSPYEAAAWSVLSARTQHAQAVKLRDALGETFPAPAGRCSTSRKVRLRTSSRACTASRRPRWRASSTASRCSPRTATRPTRSCRSCRGSARSTRA